MKRTHPFPSLLLAALLICQTSVQATDIYKGPVQALNVAKPNVIFGMDDSGSMDFEVMLTTNDGAFWWNDATAVSGVTGSGWDTKGIALFNAIGNSGSGWTKMPYLFPNGCGASQKLNCDASGHYATPPTVQFATLRSKDYNPLYYDPTMTYQPWANGVISGASKTFTASVGTAAPSHPLYTTSMNLTASTLSTTSDTVFMMRPGMAVPAGTSLYVGSKWVTQTSAFVVPPSASYTAAFAYFPATYWMKQTCTVDDVSCTKSPDGASLKRYEIKSGNTFPSGRSYVDELQNFANWFTYYRKRKLMLSASMGNVLSGLTGMRVGLVNMNAQSAPTMVDIDSTNPLTNAQAVIGKFYQNLASGGTPTRSLLNFIGNQFKTNTSIIESSCQRNAAFIVTDGFAENTAVTPSAYASSTWSKGSPYETTFAGTLADIASSFYTNNLRTDLAAGKVPTVAPTTSNPSADNNPNLHMNTYAITLGAQGTLWNGAGNAYAAPLNWPNPVDTRSPTAVDDLWHATVNSRGAMFTSRNPNETATAAQAALTEILKLGGSQGGVSFSTVNLKPGNAIAYVGSYRPQGWSGDISAYAVDTSTGALASKPTWSADTQLQSRDYTTRAIATFNGTTGVAFNATTSGTLVNPGAAYGVTTDLVSYLRGSRTLEGGTLRTRTGLMGAVVNAEPVSFATEGVVFATSNDGMVHTLEQGTGNELWAYMPSFALAAAGASSQKSWAFQTILDGTPTLGKANGHTLLVGGRGTAGTGFYALDVTNPKGTVSSASGTQSDAVVAPRVLWEFPSASTPVSVVNGIGTSLGKPLIVNTHKYGPVVVVTSGYNTALDGKGRAFVLDAITGALLHTFVTTAGAVGAGDAGLAQLAGFTEADGFVNNLYGGDLLGNVWRFGIEDGSVLNLAVLTDDNSNIQPVTAVPELATLNGKRMVFVGTGRLLGKSDLGDASKQSFYALWDNNTAISKPRTALALRTITSDGMHRYATGSAVDWTSQRGWYVELPAGEKANTDPSIAYGVLSFTTNSPSISTCTSSSALYLVDLATGLQLADSMFVDGLAFYGVQFTSTLTARVSISRLPSGRISVTTHQSDNSTTSRQLAPLGNAKPAKTAWKSVLR
jgi:type IV pilus assembly protein PilY1